MLGRLFRPFQRIPFIESLRAFLEQWGIWHYVSAAASLVMAAVVAAWSWLESALPYWGIALVFLNAFAGVLFVLDRVHAVWLRQKARRIDLPTLADEMAHAVNQMRRTLDAFERAMVPIRQGENEDHGDFMTRKWQHDNAQRQELSRQFYSRHGGDVIANYRLIETVSQTCAPFWAKTSLSDNPRFAVEYIAAASQLLARGYIDELPKLDKEFLFHLQHH